MRNLIFLFGRSVIFHVILLVALCGALYFPFLGTTPFFDKGEPREALAVQDILQRGAWLVPLKRATDIPSNPPLFHWSAALVTQATGRLDEATIRFPSALYATLGVLLIYWLGRKILNGKTALLGAAILATLLIYQDQAISARVDMTLCFYVTLDLALFYALYPGHLRNSIGFYVFFAVAGIGTLAKGPLAILLPAMVAGSFVVLERRWDVLRKFCFHPGILITLALASGWYIVAVMRGGTGFFNRQILEENLRRFVGGSGHSHPFYYYVPYLFSTTLPWAMFLPLLLWDNFKSGIQAGDDRNFLKLWVLVMFVFFSISMGKRSVYLLPLCPALALLFAGWFHDSRMTGVERGRLTIYRTLAIFSAIVGAVLVIIAVGTLSSHDHGWFFAAIEKLLKPKDLANLVAVRGRIGSFGNVFMGIALALALLWFSLGRLLWFGRMRSVALHLICLSILCGIISSLMITPVIAQEKSYRSFMLEVNRRVMPEDKLYLYGNFNNDSIAFYRGIPIEKLDAPSAAIAETVNNGRSYLILTQQSLKQNQSSSLRLSPPLIESEGKGPEGNAPLVLVAVDFP
mgnify:CR=1 FL=1